MLSRPIKFIAFGIILTVFACPAFAGQTYELVPGKHFVVPFPEHGETLDKSTARVGIRLPRNYSPDKQHPLIVYFSPGQGGDKPVLFRKIFRDDWVIVCLPYPADKKLHEMDLEWFLPLLERAYAIVPNINHQIKIVSGSVSGGVVTTTLIMSKPGMAYFTAAIATDRVADPGAFFPWPKETRVPSIHPRW